MKYSELLKMEPEDVGYSAYGVVVDELILNKRPNHLSRIGFVLNSLDVTDPSNYAMTVMLCLMTSGESKREIIAEIPSNTEIDLKMLLMLSGTKSSVSLLPPETENDDDWANYSQRLKDVFFHWLSNDNVSRLVYPLVGYFEYLVLEANGFVPKSISDDEYMLKRFVDEFPMERMDKIKDDLKIFVHEYFGGEQEFKKFISAVGVAVQKKAEDECIKYTEFLNSQQSKDLEKVGDEGLAKDT